MRQHHRSGLLSSCSLVTLLMGVGVSPALACTQVTSGGSYANTCVMIDNQIFTGTVTVSGTITAPTGIAVINASTISGQITRASIKINNFTRMKTLVSHQDDDDDRI